MHVRAAVCRSAIAIVAAILLGSCQSPRPIPVGLHPAQSAQARLWIGENDQKTINRFYAEILKSNRKGIIVLGADWCHDSVAMVDFFASPAALKIHDRYDIIFVDVGAPQYGRARNRSIAKRYGLDPMKNTPALIVVDSSGRALNSVEDARSWKNAARRSSDEIAHYFE